MTEPVKRASAWVKREWTNEEADKRFKAGYGPEEHFVWYNPMSWPPEYRMQLPVQAAYWGGTYIMNYYKQRPWYAGFVPIAAGSLVMMVATYKASQFKQWTYASREAIVQHYMELHPEDFHHLNPANSRKFNDILLPWFPRRAEQNIPLGDPRTRLHKQSE